MKQFPSGGLNQTEMIDHIKFIAKDLFQTDLQTTATKQLFSPSKNYSTVHQYNRQYHSPDQSYECFHRVKSRIKESKTDPRASKKNKKKPIFSTFEDFVRNKEKKTMDEEEDEPIMDKINKTVYHSLKEETNCYREIMGRRSPSKEEKEEIWSKFLKRESDWLEDKKRAFREVKLTEQARRNSRSPKRRVGGLRGVVGESRWKESPQGEMGEVQKGIRILKEQTEKLKMRILQMQMQQSVRQDRKEGNGLVKTFWYGHNGN